MPKWMLPVSRQLPWTMRGVDTAEHSIVIDEFGRLVMTIQHAELEHITPEDLFWWFGHIAGMIEIDGKLMSRYMVWHPEDHIHWSLARPGPNGRAEVGARFHIVEAFGRDMSQLVDVVETVTRLDTSGISLEKRIFGQVASTLVHDFGAGRRSGSSYHSTLTVGLKIPGISRVLNSVIQRYVFSPEMGSAWIRHNIEEVGLLDHLIPLARDQIQKM